MENILVKGNKVTTNNRNCFEVLDVNEFDVCCKNLLNDDFRIISKTEHIFGLFNPKLVLELSLIEIMDEVKISEDDKKHVLTEMKCRIDKWL